MYIGPKLLVYSLSGDGLNINKIDFEHDFGEDLIKANAIDIDNVVALLKSNELCLVNLKSGMVKKIENVK